MAFSDEVFLGFDPGGIDGFGAALLIAAPWSDGPNGWRPAYLGLTSMHPSTGKSAVAPTSLYGEMAVGGMATDTSPVHRNTIYSDAFNLGIF